ncbi:uncharacterized protein BX663DRAFT_547157, partial [Cokeromyces recurvatus]|uniref:uncharacterized protein n=1 Tax=Cokeromyces recurvatus TaxID=90255 RepID=UPI0022205ED4
MSLMSNEQIPSSLVSYLSLFKPLKTLLSLVNMQNNNQKYRCYCTKCAQHGRDYDEVSRSTYFKHLKDMAVPHLKEPMDLDAERADARFTSCDSGSNEEVFEEGLPFVSLLDDSNLPKEQLPFIFFMMMVMLIQEQCITDKGIELMMTFINVALRDCNQQYRFPKRAATFYKWCQLANFIHDGLKQYVSCPECHAIHSYDTEEQKVRLRGRLLCNKRQGPFRNAERCRQPLFDT